MSAAVELLRAHREARVVQRKDRVRVTVTRPGPNDGPNLRLRIKKPGEKPYRRSSGTANRAEAEAMALVLEADFETKSAAGPELLEIFDAFLVDVERRVDKGRRRPRTLTLYKNSRENLTGPLGGVRLGDVHPKLIDRLREDLGDEGFRASSAGLAIRHLRAAWRWAAREGRIPATCPWPTPERLTEGELAGMETGKRPFSPAELVTLLENATWSLPALLLLAETGCRVSEVLALTVDDLTQDARGWWAHVLDAKSRRLRRIPLTDAAVAGLDLSGGPLLVGGRGNRLTDNALRSHVVKILTKKRMRRVVAHTKKRTWDLDMHGLRRSFVQHAEYADVPESIRRALTGHKVPKGDSHGGYTRGAPDPTRLRAAIVAVGEWRRAQIATTPEKPAPHREVWYKSCMDKGDEQGQASWGNTAKAESRMVEGLRSDPHLSPYVKALFLLFGGGPE